MKTWLFFGQFLDLEKKKILTYECTFLSTVECLFGGSCVGAFFVSAPAGPSMTTVNPVALGVVFTS